MLSYIVKISVAVGVALIVYSVGIPGCSTTQFGTVKTLSCEDFPDSFNCQSNPMQKVIDQFTPDEYPTAQEFTYFDYIVSLGAVDILFVVDNSGSMAKEHKSIANQFDNFLMDIRDVDYHIAIITTDISESPDNPARNRYYQDGRFIPIGGQLFLSNYRVGEDPSRTAVEDFTEAIQREETLNCDQSSSSRGGNSWDRFYQNVSYEENNTAGPPPCPSTDERGILAINKAIRNPGQRSFFRKEAHLLIVVLSDEDVRSHISHRELMEDFEKNNDDYAESLVENITLLFGRSKNFSVNSIIVPPGNSKCYREQNRNADGGPGTGKGNYGEEYAYLSRANDELKEFGNILKGNIISICDRNYTRQLSKVAVSAETIRIPVPCGQPEDINLYVDDKKIRTRYEIEGKTLIMEPGTVSLKSELRVELVCPV